MMARIAMTMPMDVLLPCALAYFVTLRTALPAFS
jgi:hypothetical protein